MDMKVQLHFPTSLLTGSESTILWRNAEGQERTIDINESRSRSKPLYRLSHPSYYHYNEFPCEREVRQQNWTILLSMKPTYKAQIRFTAALYMKLAVGTIFITHFHGNLHHITMMCPLLSIPKSERWRARLVAVWRQINQSKVTKSGVLPKRKM